MNHKIEDIQKELCGRYGATYSPSPPNLKVGIAKNVKDNMWPLNGLRHPPEGDTTGWYFWAGEEFSEAEDFFLPLHVNHIRNWNSALLPFLGLPPGWRFLVAPDYEDVWYDETLLDV